MASDEIHDRLTGLLRDDPRPEVRGEAARALAVTHDADAVDALIAALEDPDEGVRRAATLALGRIRHPRSADALVNVLAERPALWQEAAAALASAADPEAVPRLIELLGSDEAQVRQGAARAIAAVHAAGRSREQGPLFEYTDGEGHRHPLF